MSAEWREAVRSGDVGTLMTLSAAGADPDGVEEGSGWSGLMLAAENLQAEALEVLLALGADPRFSRPDGWTALHHAVDAECDGEKQTGQAAERRMVRTLIAAGADPDAPWASGGGAAQSPREMAVRYRCAAVEALFG